MSRKSSKSHLKLMRSFYCYFNGRDLCETFNCTRETLNLDQYGRSKHCCAIACMHVYTLVFHCDNVIIFLGKKVAQAENNGLGNWLNTEFGEFANSRLGESLYMYMYCQNKSGWISQYIKHAFGIHMTLNFIACKIQ